MPYATVEQLVARFDREDNPELTQLTGGAVGIRDDVLLGEAIDEASGEMDTYLAQHHTLPLVGLTTAQADDLERICCDIARYRLWNTNPTDEVRRRYEDALAVLKQAAAPNGLRFGSQEGTTVSAASATAATVRMTRDNLGRVL